MCGINGFVTQNNITSNKLLELIRGMNDSIIHRGPDDDGVFTESHKDFSIAMGMRRLSIIDLHSGKQPIFSNDQQIVIVFNGEIYNYLKIRQELIGKGVQFKTNSDTEVILKLYEAEGISSFNKLDGMFAFSIYDKRINKIFIARDFFGEKPLYYTQSGQKFIWASELKSLIKKLKSKPDISPIGLNHFLRLTYIPAPHSIYKNIFKLEANHYLEYDINLKKYHIYCIEEEFKTEKNNIDFKTAKVQTEKLVRESVESRSISDVPIGTFLSGGVDSSVVSLCLSQMKEERINTFSIGFKKGSFDETDKSQLVAKQINSKHHEFIIGEDDLKHNIHEILLNFDEPFSDTAALPTYLVSKKTSDHVKVALTGDGGDEIFGGYNKYYVGKINSRYTTLVPKTLHNYVLNCISPLLTTKDDKRGRRFKANKMLNTVNYEGNYYWDIISLANTESQLKPLLQPHLFNEGIFDEYKNKLKITKPNSLTDYRFIDKIISLEGGMLAKVDRTSMLNSLECRAPFLNKKLWDFANSLPESYLMKGWNKKYILKEAFKHEFPEGFLDKSKQGFGSPVGDWLRSSLRREMESYIEPTFLVTQNIFQVNYVTNLVEEHLSGKKDSTYRVWAYYCFQKWYCNIYENIS
ncbi:Asparagine synthetase [glutamine-hydrolyzing] 1 [Arenibacter antarcticus]|uniref:asparagine synthase (glutamine-hydrolyzing) n=1 Tax=Arenibacter antarcticus TaxID=2040469 RepID=A0ABW5VFY0_9FLAO|nr:asparagine synthase (glutamine-hydrolyzing) [Arenibacter sp. H213]MCM4167333.1 asparagine synthase (glutamine-hydrolyzing) [Arenibacter sp. H213]